MKNIIEDLFISFASKETWKRAFYFLMRKNIEEGKLPLTKKDIIPIILAFMLAISGTAAVALILSRLLHIVGLIE